MRHNGGLGQTDGNRDREVMDPLGILQVKTIVLSAKPKLENKRNAQC